MADKNVTVDFRFPGLDKAAQDMERLGRAAREAGSGAQQAQRGVAGVGGGLRPNADLDDIFLGGGARRSPYAGIGGEPSLAESLRDRVFAQRNAVSTGSRLEEERIRFEAGEGRAGARSSQDAFRNRLATQRALEQERRAFERTDVESLATRGLESAQRRDAVKARMRQLQGLPEEEEGRGGYQNPLAGTGFARVAMPLFMTHAAGQVFEGIGKGFEEISRQSMSTDKALGVLAGRMSEGIPIIGGFARGLENLIDALSGAASRRAALHDFIGASGRQFEIAKFAGAAGGATTEQSFQAQRRLQDAIGASAGANRFAASLTPDVLASFRPVGALGEIESGVGAAELRSRRAANAAATAEDAARRRQADLAAAEAGVGPLQGLVNFRRQEAIRASQRAEALEGERANAPGFFGQLLQPGARPPTLGQLREAQAGAGQQAGLLAGADASLDRQREVVAARIKDADEAQAAAAKARLEAKRAEIDVDRARLQLQDQDINRVRGGVGAAGLRSPLQNQADLDLARAARRSPQSLSQEQWARLRGNPIFSQFAEQTGQELGRQDPAVQQAVREFGGLGGQTLEEAEKQRNKTLDDLTKRMAQADADFGTKAADIFGNSFEKLIDTFLKMLDTKINERINELTRKEMQQRAQAKG